MAVPLHTATVLFYEQMLGTVAHLLDAAEAFCRDRAIPPADLLQARLAEDMLPLAYQVKSTMVHSLGAIEGVRHGRFSPDTTTPPDSFEGLRTRVANARATLAAIDPAEIEGFVGRDMAFVMGERRIPFTAEDFLLTFSQPNLSFHVTITYAILRARGVPLGKRDFLRGMRTKG